MSHCGSEIRPSDRCFTFGTCDIGTVHIQLRGIYFQAVQQQNFDVAFVRMR